MLLDKRTQPHATLGFGAYMILTNGQWPPRGLLSGMWPPQDETTPAQPDSTTAQAGAPISLHAAQQPPDMRRDSSPQPASGAVAVAALQPGPTSAGAPAAAPAAPASSADVPAQRGRLRSGRRATYVHIIHCGSMRQEARVLRMQELPSDLAEQSFEVAGVNLAAAAAAATVLLDGASPVQHGADDGQADADDEGTDLAGTLVDAQFRFTGRHEWLVPGMRFIVRDQRAHLSGVGVVHSVDPG